MSPQPPNTYPAAHPDARIDQVLHALRTTEAPSGLEQRIAARLAQAAEARTQSAITNPTTFSYVTVILNAVKDPRILLARAPRYWAAAAALTLLIALTTLTLLHRSESAVRALLFRARTRLRERLEKQESLEKGKSA